MIKINKTVVFCVSIIVIFCCIQIFISQYSIETEIDEDIMEMLELKEELTSTIEVAEKTEIWQIEIPSISLVADISEGTTRDVLNKYVGHFEKTEKENGNVGLAAHNRGYEVNYFKDLKLLQKGDEIRYVHNECEKIYIVEKCRIIKDTEWEYLEQTEDNMLTLITCVENQPEYRRCVQAVEKDAN